MVKSFTEELNEELKKRTETDEERLGKLHAEAQIPHPLMLDEVSASFISWLRVQSWEDLGTDFGGYRIGRILAYILDVLNEKIEDSTAATIKVDIPLYEQCSTVSCKCGGKCKHNKSQEDEEKFCLHCKESDGTINHDVFTKIFDEDLGFGWICKECFLQSCKETEELLKEKCEEVEQLEKQISFKDKCLKHIENMAKDPIDYFPDKSKMEALIKTRKESYIKAAQNGLEGLYNVNKN